jgi:hypothetical protein
LDETPLPSRSTPIKVEVDGAVNITANLQEPGHLTIRCRAAFATMYSAEKK